MTLREDPIFYTLFFDGCSKGNPGRAGAGAVLYKNQVEVYADSLFVGEKETNNVFRSLPLPIHHLVFSEEQFQEMISSKELNVGKEALNNNIILYGVEPYYEML